MALPNTGITTTLVGTTLGVATRNVGNLCKAESINKWSKWKPVRSSKLVGLTVTDMENLSSGLERVDMYAVVYNSPRGVDGTYNEPFRLGDFRNYNHSAIPPVNVEIVSFFELQSGVTLTPPCTLFYNYTYRIRFRLPIAGEIDPSTIHPNTVRQKNKLSGGAYGGLSFVSGTNNEVTRTDSEVFSAPMGPGVVLEQDVTMQPNGLSPALRLQYCQYNGFETDDFTTVPYAVEDIIFLDNVSFAYLDLTLALNTFWDGLAQMVNSHVAITNNSGRQFLGARVRYVYTIDGGIQRTTTASVDVAATGVTDVNAGLIAGAVNMNNTYAVTAYLEVLNPQTSEWFTLAQTNRSQVVFIPA